MIISADKSEEYIKIGDVEYILNEYNRNKMYISSGHDSDLCGSTLSNSEIECTGPIEYHIKRSLGVRIVANQKPDLSIILRGPGQYTECIFDDSDSILVRRENKSIT